MNDFNEPAAKAGNEVCNFWENGLAILGKTFCNFVEKVLAKNTEDLPALRQTPQMLAAGWGGAGTVKAPVPAARLSGTRRISEIILASFMSDQK
jgi:hypothetical protein